MKLISVRKYLHNKKTQNTNPNIKRENHLQNFQRNHIKTNDQMTISINQLK